MTSEEIIFVCSLSATSISKHRRSHHKLTSLWPLSVHAPWSKSFPAESWCRLLHNKQSLENHIQPFTAGLPSLLCFLFLYRWRMWRVSISSIIDTDLCIGEWAPNVPKWQETVQKRGGISSNQCRNISWKMFSYIYIYIYIYIYTAVSSWPGSVTSLQDYISEGIFACIPARSSPWKKPIMSQCA